MEKEYFVIPVGVKYICNFCGGGEMIPTNKNNWSVDPPNFEHKCNNCGKEILLNEKYPTIRYKLKE